MRPRQWATAYVDFAAGEKQAYLRDLGLRFLPSSAGPSAATAQPTGHGNSVPRFHLTWGIGPEVVRVFLDRVESAERTGTVIFGHRHRIDEIVVQDGAAVGVRGSVLALSEEARGVASSRDVVGDFDLRAQAVVVASGGIGHNFDPSAATGRWITWGSRRGPWSPACRHTWTGGCWRSPKKPAPTWSTATGCGSARGQNTEGIQNWDPVWDNHGIRILPGPSSLWLDATGRRLPAPCYPGFESLGTLAAIGHTGYDYTWFVLTRAVIETGVRAVRPGAEPGPDRQGRPGGAARPAGPRCAGAGAALPRPRRGLRLRADAGRTRRGMNRIAPGPLLDLAAVQAE